LGNKTIGVGAFDVPVLQYYFEVVREILRVFAKTKGSGGVSFQQNHGNTLVTIGRLRDNFEVEVTVQDVHKQRYGRPFTSMIPFSSAVVLPRFIRAWRGEKEHDPSTHAG